jgi:hypothetical protein
VAVMEVSLKVSRQRDDNHGLTPSRLAVRRNGICRFRFSVERQPDRRIRAALSALLDSGDAQKITRTWTSRAG